MIMLIIFISIVFKRICFGEMLYNFFLIYFFCFVDFWNFKEKCGKGMFLGVNCFLFLFVEEIEKVEEVVCILWYLFDVWLGCFLIMNFCWKKLLFL